MVKNKLCERIGESWTLAYRVTLPILRNHEDAEDVAQETLVKASAALDNLRNEESLLPWIACIAKRMALNRLRSERLRDCYREISFHCDCAPSAMDEILEHERSDRLWARINALPEYFRGALILVSIEERSVAEAAVALNVPEGTVKSRLLRARTRLKRSLSV